MKKFKKLLVVFLSLVSLLVAGVAVAAPSATIITLQRYSERGYVLEAGDGQEHQSEVNVTLFSGETLTVPLTWQSYEPDNRGSWAQLPYTNTMKSVGPIIDDGTSIATYLSGWEADSHTRTFVRRIPKIGNLFLPKIAR